MGCPRRPAHRRGGRVTTQAEGPDGRLCGCVREKGNPRTLETYVYRCDLLAGHEGGHEGQVDGGTDRLGWPAKRDEKAAVGS